MKTYSKRALFWIYHYNMESIEAFYSLQKGKDNKILRTKSDKIKSINEDIKEFAEILLYLMEKYDGVGLASPQIGKNIQMIAITKWKENKKTKKRIDEFVMINPEIITLSKEKNIDKEACLSLPGIEKDVERCNEIYVKYTTINKIEKKERFKGFNARIIQHEIDHLHGILFIDKAKK